MPVASLRELCVPNIRIRLRLIFSAVNRPSFSGKILAANLKHLEFESGWVPTYSRSLEFFKLTWNDAVRTPRPSATAVAKALLRPNCGSLVHIELLDALYSPTAEDVLLRALGVSNFSALKMPRLRTLRMEGCALSYGRILGALVCPEIESIRLAMACQALSNQQTSVPSVLRDVVSRIRTSWHLSARTGR